MAQYFADLTLNFDTMSRGAPFKLPYRWIGSAPNPTVAQTLAEQAARIAYPSLTSVVQVNTGLQVALASPPGDH